MAERIIDGTENNIFNLLCNLADSENSIALKAVNGEIEGVNSKIDDISKKMETVTSKLDDAKAQEGTMKKGPAAFSDFVDKFNNNTLLINYFRILGYDDYLKDPVASHEEEQRTNAKYDEIVSRISSLSGEIEKLENEYLMLNSKLENDNRILEYIRNFTNRIELLINASVSGNGSYTKDYVIETLSYFQDVSKEFGIVFPSNYIESGSMAIFFPEKGFADVVSNYKKGNAGTLKYVEEEDTTFLKEGPVLKDNLFNISADPLTSSSEEEPPQETDEMEDPQSIIDEDLESSGKELAFSVPMDEEDIQTVDQTEGENIQTVDQTEGEDIQTVGQTEGEDIQIVGQTEEGDIQTEEDLDGKIIDFSTAMNEMPTLEEDDDDYSFEEPSSKVEEPVNIFEEIEPTVSEPEVEDVSSLTNPDDSKVINSPDVFARMQASIDDRGHEYDEMIEEDEASNKFGLDASLVSEELSDLLKSADAKVVKNNIDNLEALNIDKHYFYEVVDGYSLLTDVDLVNKINYLRGKKVPEKSVKNAVESGWLRGSLESIKAGIIALENSEYGFDKKYLPLLKYGVQPFFDSIECLKKSGIEPDESEIRAFLIILSRHYKNIEMDTEVLKDYSVGALRSNGKFELGYGMQPPKQLIEFLDAVIELGEEDLINNVPEVLSMNLDTVLKRLWYAKSNGIDYKEGTVYADYIIKPGLFNREFNNPELGEIKSCEECNKYLETTLNNDLCSIFIEVLDKYYDDSRSYKSVELNEEQRGIYDKLKGMLESLFSASLVSKNAYDIQGTIISRNKFERNLSCLVCTLNDNGEDLISEAKEILLVSALYNSRRPEEMMLKIPQEIQEESVSMGGMAA